MRAVVCYRILDVLLFGACKEVGDMQKLWTLPRKQSWSMTSTLDGYYKVSVFPRWACKVSFISYWAYYCIVNYGARRKLKSCYCLSGFSISSSNYVFEHIIIRFYVFN